MSFISYGAELLLFFIVNKIMFQQEKRVLKGWFPENPARHEYYESIRAKRY